MSLVQCKNNNSTHTQKTKANSENRSPYNENEEGIVTPWVKCLWCWREDLSSICRVNRAKKTLAHPLWKTKAE